VIGACPEALRRVVNLVLFIENNLKSWEKDSFSCISRENPANSSCFYLFLAFFGHGIHFATGNIDEYLLPGSYRQERFGQIRARAF
jgi:hypothetical protein